MRKGFFYKCGLLLPIILVLLISALPSWAQPVVPGFNVEVYATMSRPTRLAFDPSGVLYAGADDGPKIYRVAVGGSLVEQYGDTPLSDPDAVAFDGSGAISGSAGSVLVGGFPGHISAILPDQTTKVIFAPGSVPNMENPQALKFDTFGRLIIVDNWTRLFFVSTGTTPITLGAADSVSFAIDPANRIFIQRSFGLHGLKVVNADGSTSTVLSDFPDSISGLAFGPYNATWGGDLVAISQNPPSLYRVDNDGRFKEIGTGFVGGDFADVAFGPDGALYVSDSNANVIYRIFPSDRIQNPDNGHWYQRFDNIMTWHEAKAHCEDLGGYLATLTSQDENNFVYNNLVNPAYNYWLGGTDEVVEGDWRWITGETWSYTNWAPWQPDDAHGGQDYLLFWNTYPNTWDDAGCPGTCSYESGFICEYDPPNYCKADINNDGDVDGEDLAELVFEFGRTDCP